MANSKANIMQIPLNTELNLNKVDSDIKQFIGFNKNNASFIGGCLSGLFTKELSTPANTIVDSDGNLISYNLDTKYFEKNGKNFFFNKFEDTEVVLKHEAKLWNGYTGADIPIGETVVALAYDNENSYDYILRNGSTVYVCYYYIENDEIVHAFQRFDNQDATKICNLYRYGDIFIFDIGSIKKCLKNGVETWSKSGLGSAVPIRSVVSTATGRTGQRFFYVGSTELDGNGVLVSNEIKVKPSGFADGSATQNFVFINDCLSYSWATESGSNAHIVDMIPLATIKPTGSAGIYEGAARLRTETVFTSSSKNGGNMIGAGSLFEYFAGVKFWEKYTDQNQILCYPLGFWEEQSYKGAGTEASTTAFKDPMFPFRVKRGNFHFLFNNKVLSGISYNNVLLTEWFSIDDSYLPIENENKQILYKDAKGKFYILSVENISETNFKCYLFNDKVFTNFASGAVLDLYKNKLLKAFPDFNGRPPFLYGSGGKATDKTYHFAAGVNTDYTNGRNDIVSMMPNELALGSERQYINEMDYDSDDIALPVDIYKVDINEVYNGELPYDKTYTAYDTTSFEGSKLDLLWVNNTEGNMLLTPSIFGEFVGSGLNLDMVKEDSDSYRLYVYNNKPIYAYYLNTLVEDIEAPFTIQGQTYIIIAHKIYNYDAQNGIATTSQAIVNVQDLQFLAATPYKAFFYSPLTQSVLSFNGSNTLNYEFTATKINRIIDSVYNPDTLSIIFTSDKEVIFISRFGMFSIPKQSEENNERIYISKKGVAIVYPAIELVQFLRYTKTTTEDLTEFDKKDIELETCFYGLENQKMSVNDCVYLRLFDEEKNAGQIEISATTISLSTKETDKTVISVKPSDWDKDSKTLFVRYQPKQQRGLGTSFKIKSPFNIISMAIGNIPDSNLIDNVSKGSFVQNQKNDW